jgi:hypothetical protein
LNKLLANSYDQNARDYGVAQRDVFSARFVFEDSLLMVDVLSFAWSMDGKTVLGEGTSVFSGEGGSNDIQEAGPSCAAAFAMTAEFSHNERATHSRAKPVHDTRSWSLEEDAKRHQLE